MAYRGVVFLVAGLLPLGSDAVALVKDPGLASGAGAAAATSGAAAVAAACPSPPPQASAPAPPQKSPEELQHKPAGDPRSYQYSRLANGLEVVNIHDEGSTQAAFSVAVTAGSFYDYDVTQDSVKYLGLAHLTEHALFLGSCKFPDESGFDRFLASHGGSSNAYTSVETTVYYGDLSANAFEEGLQRFADMFAAPLLKADRIWSEVEAVNSEHSKNVHNPSWQTQGIMLHLASPRSPLQWFHTGDKATLEHAGEKPLAERLQAYFDQNYCPPRMRLVTVGPAALDLQFKNATEAFGGIPAAGHSGACDPTPKSFEQPLPFDSTRVGQFLHVQGSSPQLWLLFPMEENLGPWHKSHPMLYIQYLIGFGGPRSLKYTLRDSLEIADSVSVWSDDSSAGTQVWLVADLTAKGARAPDAVLDTILSYLERARRAPVDLDILNSLVRSARLGWDWAPLQRPMDAASQVAEEMTRLGHDELLSADSLVEQPDVARIKKVLGQLRPNNVNVGFMDLDAETSFKPTLTVHKLPFYGTKYTLERLSARFPKMSGWAADGDGSCAGVKAACIDEALAARLKDPKRQPRIEVKDGFSMAFPGPILGLPEHLLDPSKEPAEQKALREANASHLSELGKIWGKLPRKISSSGGDLFFRQGWMLPRPRVFAVFSFRSRREHIESEQPLAERLRLSLGMGMLVEQMGEALENLARAGASWSLSLSPEGLGLTFSGYELTLSSISSMVLEEFNRGLDTTNTKRCERQVTQYAIQLGDNTMQALTQAGEDLSILITPNTYAKAELLQALNGAEISCAAAAGAIKKGRGATFSDTSLVLGSCTEKDAVQLHKEVIKGLDVNTSLGASEVKRIQHVVRPAGPVELRARNPQFGDKNHVLLLEVLVGVATIEQKVLLGLVGGILSQTIFQELRTNMQLGYNVGGGVSMRSNVLTVSCYVQGQKKQPDELEALFEKVFSHHVPAAIGSLTDKTLASHKTAFRDAILQKPTSTDQEAVHFESELLLRSCPHSARSRLEFLKQVKSKEQLLEAWNDAVLSKNIRTKVAVKYWGHDVEIPQKPTAMKWRGVLEHAGFGNNDTAYVRSIAERKKTTYVDASTSATRATLVASSGANGYFSDDMHCSTRTTNGDHEANLFEEVDGEEAQTRAPGSGEDKPDPEASGGDDPGAESSGEGALLEVPPEEVTAGGAAEPRPVARPALPVRQPRVQSAAALVRREQRRAESTLGLLPGD